jgi:hydroxymethylpyrimidine kinase/phosphomethylpyrimidine kinase
VKNILAIAGFDPSSGAGITKDLDVFFSLGMHGFSVPTCIVNQGPKGVTGIYPVPPDQFSYMLEAVTGGIRIDGVKIGVMWDESHVEVLSEFIKAIIEDNLSVSPLLSNEGEGVFIPVVLDPIISAKNNTRLITDRGLKKLVDSVLPQTTVITPNIDEAHLITGTKIECLNDMKACAKKILNMGPNAVVIKGGHLKGEPIDLLYDGNEFTTWQKKRIDREVHGTGCTFSSLLISFLVHGYHLKDAFIMSEQYMQDLLKETYRIADNGYFYMSSAIASSGFKRKIS